MTAVQLLAELRDDGCEPGVENAALVFESDPPARLAPYLEVLHTGVRAILTGKRWFGFDGATGKACGPYPARGHGPLAFGSLDPAQLLPRNVGYLCVESDPCWDRIPSFAKHDAGATFLPESEEKVSRKAVAK